MNILSYIFQFYEFIRVILFEITLIYYTYICILNILQMVTESFKYNTLLYSYKEVYINSYYTLPQNKFL